VKGAGAAGALRFVAFTWLGRGIVGLAVVGVVGAAVIAPRLTSGSPQPALRTAQVAKGNVTQTVGVSGSINASALVKTSFRPSGRLAEILVKVGDTVTAGQPLARLETFDLQTAVKQAEANLLSAQAKYDQTVAGASAEDLALAKNALDSAVVSYEQTKKNTALDLTNAQSTLDKANRSLADAKTTTASDVAAALQSLTRTKTSYSTARTNFSSLTGGLATDIATYTAALATMRSRITTAISSIAAVEAVGGAAGIASAKTSLYSADLSLVTAQNAVSALDSALGEHRTAVAALVAAADAFDKVVASSTDTSSVTPQYTTAQTNYTLAASRLTGAIDTVATSVTSASTSVSSAWSSVNSDLNRDNSNLFVVRENIVALQKALTDESQLSSAIKSKVTQAGTALATITEAVNGSIVNAQQAYTTARSKAQTTLQTAEEAAASAAQALTTAQDKAASTLATTEITLSNARVSYAKSTATPRSTDIAIALSGLQLAQIALDKAKADLENATLKAPVAGVISSLTNQVGEAPANPFAVIAVTSTLTLHGTIGESEVAKIKLGQVATLGVDAVASGTRLTGKVTGLDPVATLQQGVPVYGIDITIDRPDPAVRPGMTATATVIIQSKQGVLTVPNSAIRTVAGRRGVQVLENGVAVDGGEVVFGISNDAVTEVISGLTEGQTVVLPAPRTTTTAGQGQGGGQRFGAPVPGGGVQIIQRP
jgi:HlyD family secretion protein